MEMTTIPMEELMSVLQLQLDNGGIAELVVTGNSMYPMLLHRRDRVVLSPLQTSPQKGDVILYRRENGAYILHRIITVPKGGKFFCAGDNQWVRESVEASQILARVVSFTRKGKRREVSSLFYRVYVTLWIALFPVRKPLIRMRRRIGRLRKKLRG